MKFDGPNEVKYIDIVSIIFKMNREYSQFPHCDENIMSPIFRFLSFVLITNAMVGLSFPSIVKSAPKSDKQAAALVQRWLKKNPKPLESKIAADIDYVETDIDDTGAPLYYIVHTKPRGFIIVAADDLIEPIIGFFPNAEHFSPLSDSPLAAMLKRDMPGRMEMVRLNSKNFQMGKVGKEKLPKKQRIANEKWGKLLEDEPPGDLKTMDLPDSSIDDIRVYPFIGSRWSQSSEYGEYCYNYYTPNHYVSGCTATAMAQLMRFYQYPQGGVGTTRFSIEVNNITQYVNLKGGDGAGGSYAWSNMVLDPNASITETEREAIGALLYDAGISIHTSYSASGSAASLIDAATSLVDTFGYGNSVFGANYNNAWLNLTESQVEKMINSNLDAGYPVILGISGDGGHAILTDGYGTNGTTVYHHLNMGWAGYDDGWYNMPDIQTTSYDFNVVDTLIYNIFKQGSGEVISGRIVDNSGLPIEGATVTAISGGASYTDITDERGVFAFAQVPSATSFTVSASVAGYLLLPAERNITTATSANNTYWLKDWPSSGNVWGVDFTGSVELRGDIDGSGQVDVVDAILVLQVLSGKDTIIPVTINSNIDVNADQRIGLVEAIHALQQAAIN